MPVCTTPAWFPSCDVCLCHSTPIWFCQGDVTDEASGGVHNKTNDIKWPCSGQMPAIAESKWLAATPLATGFLPA